MNLFAQTDRGATKPHIIQPGERFGELTTVRIVEADRNGHRWLCVCDCGRHALRLASGLNLAVRKGWVSSCAECRLEVLRGRAAVGAEARREWLSILFEETGSLYTANDERQMAEDIRAALIAEVAPERDDVRMPWIDPTWRDEPTDEQRRRMSSLRANVSREREQRWERVRVGRWGFDS